MVWCGVVRWRSPAYTLGEEEKPTPQTILQRITNKQPVTWFDASSNNVRLRCMMWMEQHSPANPYQIWSTFTQDISPPQQCSTLICSFFSRLLMLQPLSPNEDSFHGDFSLTKNKNNEHKSSSLLHLNYLALHTLRLAAVKRLGNVCVSHSMSSCDLTPQMTASI